MFSVNPKFSLTIVVVISTVTACTSFRSEKLPDSVVVTPFEATKTSIEHNWNKDTSFPFTSGAAIDIDNDGTMEIFVSGGHDQDDALLSYRNGALNAIDGAAGTSKRTASYGATAIDINNDGMTDLLVARDDGVWLHINNNGQFDSNKIIDHTDGKAITLSVSVADIDLDGDIDLYLNNFIAYKLWSSSTFNDPDHIGFNRLLRNDGNLVFTDITDSSGIAGSQNTFVSSFTDLDQDGYQDLVIANNTGTLEIFHNEGNSTFTKNTYSSGLGYWMGLGIGDFDGDGDQDIAASNAGSSIPAALLRGDLTDEQSLEIDWVVLRNDGRRVFTDITDASGVSGQGFGWGIVFEDLNLDGNLDLLAAQSYIKWPVHKLLPLQGLAMLQVAGDQGLRFINAPGLSLKNANFGQSAIIADINGDAKQDVIWVNMNGPVQAHINQHSSDVVTLAVPENAKWLGARVTAITSNGNSYTREINNSIGMQTDQTPHVSFAVPANGSINRLEVHFSDGSTTSFTANGHGLIQP